MANDINCFVDNAHLNSSNSLTHLLQSDDTEELNVIRHSPYISVDELLLSRINKQNGLSLGITRVAECNAILLLLLIIN